MAYRERAQWEKDVAKSRSDHFKAMEGLKAAKERKEKRKADTAAAKKKKDTQSKTKSKKRGWK